MKCLGAKGRRYPSLQGRQMMKWYINSKIFTVLNVIIMLEMFLVWS